MIWTLPLLLFLLHFVIQRGLKPLKQLSMEIEKRDHRSMMPLPIKQAPDEVKPLTQALNRLLARLQEAFEKESHFTADASHELRTPLAGIRSQAQLALRQCKDPTTSSSLNKILSGLDRCDRLVEQMLTLHRFNPEQAGNLFEIFDLDALSQSVCTDLKPIADKKSIQLIKFSPNYENPLLIQGNPHGIYILIKNIVENAINYSPENSAVHLDLQDEQNTIRLSVTDSGPGISPEIRHRVFNRFYRQADNQTPGSGLGLSIVKQMADLHQAKIKLANANNTTGLEFSVSFKKPNA